MGLCAALIVAVTTCGCGQPSTQSDASLVPGDASVILGGGGCGIFIVCDDMGTDADIDVGTDADIDAYAEDAWAPDAYCTPCTPSSECMEVTGCDDACSESPVANGTTCATGICVAGDCVEPGVCGNGLIEGLERCDDGNEEDGDACSATCAPTRLIIASERHMRETPSAQVPSGAEDGNGNVLFVWLAERLVVGEPFYDLVGRRYTATGEPLDAEPIHLEDGIGLSQPVSPAVTGRIDGWAVVWRSNTIEPASVAEQGGIALCLISGAGDVGTRKLVNQSTRWDQVTPRVGVLETSMFVVWSDLSVDGSTGRLRMRFFDGTGRATSSELAVTTTSSNAEAEPFVITAGTAAVPDDSWAVAWSSTAADVEAVPQVRMRRFMDRTVLDTLDVHASHAWGSGAALALSPDGLFVAWTGRVDDSHGDAVVRDIETGTSPTDDMDADSYAADDTMLLFRDDQPVVAQFPRDGSDGYVAIYRTLAAPRGGRVAASMGVTLPPEASDLADFIDDGQESFSVIPTDQGLWVAWSDPTLTDATTAFVAYLLPWE